MHVLGSSVVAMATLLPAQQPAATEVSARDLLGIGWRWEIPPTGLRDGWAPAGKTPPKEWTEQGQAFFVPSGWVLAVLPASRRPLLCHLRTKDLEKRGSDAPEYRAILLPAAGEPIHSLMSIGRTRDGLAETRYMFPELTGETEIAKVALGVLDGAGRLERARDGQQRAERLGASVLPLPRVGQQLTFDLPTIDGARFRSADQLGKVVVIDCWAVW